MEIINELFFSIGLWGVPNGIYMMLGVFSVSFYVATMVGEWIDGYKESRAIRKNNRLMDEKLKSGYQRSVCFPATITNF